MHLRRRRESSATAEFNMTPLIDVTFQLIIFFILAGSFASRDNLRLDLPQMAGSRRVADLDPPQKVVINVLPFEPIDGELADYLTGRAEWYRVRAWRGRAGDVDGLADQLALAREQFEARKMRDPVLTDVNLHVELRADRSIRFQYIRPVLKAVARAGFERVNYVAIGSLEGS